MLMFAHLGLGSKIVRLFTKDIPLGWIYLGTMVPDIIDKPLYYIMSHLTDKTGAEIGLISGTRTFGHSGILLLLIILFVLAGSSRFTALLLGFLSHIILDVVCDPLELFDTSATIQAFIFPLLGFQFFVSPFHNMNEHMASKFSPVLIAGEVLGFAFLLYDAYQWRKNRANINIAPR